jgi:hypothetical protein
MRCKPGKPTEGKSDAELMDAYNQIAAERRQPRKKAATKSTRHRQA